MVVIHVLSVEEGVERRWESEREHSIAGPETSKIFTLTFQIISALTRVSLSPLRIAHAEIRSAVTVAGKPLLGVM